MIFGQMVVMFVQLEAYLRDEATVVLVDLETAILRLREGWVL